MIIIELRNDKSLVVNMEDEEIKKVFRSNPEYVVVTDINKREYIIPVNSIIAISLNE